MRALRGAFISGLMLALPIALTAYVVWWLGATAEAVLGPALRLVLPGDWYLPGLGVVLGFALILALGILMRFWIVQWFWGWLEWLLDRMPLVKTIYGAIRDMTGYFSNSRKKDYNQVVLMPVGETGVKLMGFVTRESFDDVPLGLQSGEKVAVYLPMSYQIGGFTCFVDRESLQRVDMSMEEAMRFALTAGVKKDAESQAAGTGRLPPAEEGGPGAAGGEQ